MSGAALVIGAAVIFIGSAVQGGAGFGMGLLAVPAVLRLFGPAMVTPLVVSVAFFLNFSIFLKIRRDTDRSIIVPLLVGAFLGALPGSYVPGLVPLDSFKFFVGLFVVASGVILWLGWRCPITNKFLRFAVGLFSGFLNGSISLSGPPVAIFLAAGSVPKKVFRASMASYFLALNCFTMVIYASRGVMTADFLKILAVLVPSSVLGSLVGGKIAASVPERTFRAVVLALIVLSGLTLLF